jgi:DNA-binding SARP family transcriptional activator
MEQSPASFGEVVRTRRRSLGLSQRELAEQAALSLRALRNLEQGRIHRPRASSVRRLIEALRLPCPGPDRLAGVADAPPDEPRLHIGVLGPLVVTGRGWPEVATAKARCLLGLLAIQPCRPVTIEEIVNVLWGSRPPPSWPESLHHHVWQLRKLLEPGRPQRAPSRILIRTSGSYQLDVGADQLDLLRFDLLAGRTREVDPTKEPQRAAQLWTEALQCWRGRVLADLDTALRLHPAAVAISGRRLAATLAYADLAIGLGRCEQAVEYLRPVVVDEPLHEGLHARLMLALAGCGQQAAALAAYAELCSRLADDLGVEPGRELQQAHVRVLRHDVPSSGPPAAGSVDHPNGRVAPAQLPASAPGFTGRAEQIAELDALLEAATDRRPGRGGRGDGDGRQTGTSVTAIAGTAGVGKTALALHWAHRVADRFPDGQLYLNLRGFDASDAAMTPAEALPASWTPWACRQNAFRPQWTASPACSAACWPIGGC